MLTKEFTPELQIFYILLKVFGLNVQVPVLELDKWNIFQEFGLNVQVSGVKFSKSFTQRQKRVYHIPLHGW